jgi:hypothetical protein
MAENRKLARRAVSSQAALIYTGHREQPIMCTVANISGQGADLTVLNTNGIPEIFDLQSRPTKNARVQDGTEDRPP